MTFLRSPISQMHLKSTLVTIPKSRQKTHTWTTQAKKGSCPQSKVEIAWTTFASPRAVSTAYHRIAVSSQSQALMTSQSPSWREAPLSLESTRNRSFSWEMRPGGVSMSSVHRRPKAWIQSQQVLILGSTPWRAFLIGEYKGWNKIFRGVWTKICHLRERLIRSCKGLRHWLMKNFSIWKDKCPSLRAHLICSMSMQKSKGRVINLGH